MVESTKKKARIVWVAWERHRRTIELSKVFSCDLLIFESRWPRVIKHPWFLIKTWKTIHEERPDILVVQNPSIVLSLIACVLKSFYRYRLVVDSHNAGLVPSYHWVEPFDWIYKMIQKMAHLTIVTNEELAKIVKKGGGLPYVLPDKIPDVSPSGKIELKGIANVLCVCTFGKDEPYREMLEAAQLLKGKDLIVYITGAYSKIDTKLLNESPPNVIFTGYIPDKDYWDLLSSVNLVVDLTLRQNCLVCGAYESLAVGTPMVLSETDALKKYFHKGAVFCENNAASIASAIENALENEFCLREQANRLKQELSDSWQERVTPILKYFESVR